MEWIWKLELPASVKFVYLALQWRDGLKGCYPSQQTLVAMTGLGESTVRRAIRWLEKAGYLTVIRERDRSNTYVLTPMAKAEAKAALLKLSTTGHGDRIGSGHGDRMIRSKGPKGPVMVTAYREIDFDRGRPEGLTPAKPERSIGTYQEYLREIESGAATPPLESAAESGDGEPGAADSLSQPEPGQAPALAVTRPEKRSSGMNSAGPSRIAQDERSEVTR